MARITFKAKPVTYYNMDDTIAFTEIAVPKIARRHCNMDEFRKHAKIGSYANSDMFSGFIARALRGMGIEKRIRLDQPLPDGVAIDASGFLSVVTIDL